MRLTLAALIICILTNLGLPTPINAGPGFPGSPDQTMPAPSLFVALAGRDGTGAVAVLDPTTNKIRRVARFPVTYFPMVASPTKPLLFVLDGNSATQIYFINTNTIGLVGTVTTTSEITGMTLGDNGNILYAASGNQVLEISVQTRTIKAAITLPGSVFDVAVVGQGHRLYATLPDLHEFAVIDATTNTVRGFVRAGHCDYRTGRHDPCYPRDIRTSPGGRYAIAVSGHNAIAIDTMTGTVLASPAVETFDFSDYALAVDPSTDELWINGAGVKHSQYTSIDMLPPFNVVSSFAEFHLSAPNSAAFTPNGQGYGSFYGDAREKVTFFPPSQDGLRLHLGTPAGPIIYVP